MEEAILLKHKIYKVIDKIEENEDYLLFKVNYKEEIFALIAFKNVEVYSSYVKNYKTLKESGINLPKLKKNDKEHYSLLLEYLEGTKLSDLLLRDKELDELIIKALFDINSYAKFNNIYLSYLPENFIYSNNKLYYLSTSYVKLENKTRFIDEGIIYFLPTKEGIEHLKTLDSEYKNTPLEKGELSKQIVLLSIKYWW